MTDDANAGGTGSVTTGATNQRWERAASTGTVVWGLILLAVGAWFFVEITLGYDLPAIDWGVIWPIVIIVLGGWVILRAATRRDA